MMPVSTNAMNTQQGFTPMQLHLVSMLSFNQTKEAEQRLQAALLQFYSAEFERAKAEQFANGKLSEELITEGASRHFRTAYFSANSKLI